VSSGNEGEDLPGPFVRKVMLLAVLAGLALRYAGPAEGAVLLPPTADLARLGPGARSPAKREALAVIGVLLVTGYRLWEAGWVLGLGWGTPEPTEILGFLACLEVALA
jgi:hypothetical protein